MKSLGNHILVEFYGCNPKILNDAELIEKIMLEAARISGATIVSHDFHTFNPHGVSGVVVIAESHLTIHTWPEYEYAAVDLFTCGDTVDAWKGFIHLRNELDSGHISTVEMKRGQLHNIKGEIRHKPENAEI
ncbi:MAG: adenosylmethionine decarboxylase [Candidatus Cloacimonadota bacterium]|nr:MAG: adenosylmethionine decarboxylase [Candidatus Cloacimonadota bacterium]PIE79285.1 MAG: adenosylmethionine decarboxylase [Candidatus Delongbacteria bacterium]